MTDRLVAVFHLAHHMTDSLSNQGLFPLMTHLPILEPREGLVLTSMRLHEMVANTKGF